MASKSEPLRLGKEVWSANYLLRAMVALLLRAVISVTVLRTLILETVVPAKTAAVYSGRIQETASPSTMERAVELLKGYNYKQAFKLLAKSSVSAHKAIMDIAKKTIEEEVMSAYCKLKDGQININMLSRLKDPKTYRVQCPYNGIRHFFPKFWLLALTMECSQGECRSWVSSVIYVCCTYQSGHHWVLSANLKRYSNYTYTYTHDTNDTQHVKFIELSPRPYICIWWTFSWRLLRRVQKPITNDCYW